MTRYYYMVVMFQTSKGTGYQPLTTSFNGCAPIVGALQRVKEMHPDAITSSLLVTTCIEIDEDEYIDYGVMLSEEKKKKNEEN